MHDFVSKLELIQENKTFGLIQKASCIQRQQAVPMVTVFIKFYFRSGNIYHVRLCQARIRMPTLALKPRGDVTRSPKQGYQWSHKRTCVLQKSKKKSSTSTPFGLTLGKFSHKNSDRKIEAIKINHISLEACKACRILILVVIII